MTVFRGLFKIGTNSNSPFQQREELVLSRNTVRRIFSWAIPGASQEQLVAARTLDLNSATYTATELP